VKTERKCSATALAFVISGVVGGLPATGLAGRKGDLDAAFAENMQHCFTDFGVDCVYQTGAEQLNAHRSLAV
jgi:hypothetical protein